ncbi:MAG TPA: hypothetical protein VGN26_12120 [Armatimonadota bacterium]
MLLILWLVCLLTPTGRRLFGYQPPRDAIIGRWKSFTLQDCPTWSFSDGGRFMSVGSLLGDYSETYSWVTDDIVEIGGAQYKVTVLPRNLELQWLAMPTVVYRFERVD